MSREIKFKVWDNDKKEMYYDINTDKQNSIMDMQIIFDVLGCGVITNYLNGDSWNEVNNFELLQYTGLKDKNDKEIYEGDIVNIINNSVDEDDGYFIVKYDIETARYILSGNSLVYDFDNTYANECEVIGSIYENPELLKE